MGAIDYSDPCIRYRTHGYGTDPWISIKSMDFPAHPKISTKSVDIPLYLYISIYYGGYSLLFDTYTTIPKENSASKPRYGRVKVKC